MKTNILDFIDFEKVNTLLEGFNQSTGFVTAILDLEGNVLSKSGWRQICTEFHPKNPETVKKRTISDTELAGKLAAGEKYHFYKCLNGLVDVAVPIIIKGEHIANLFSGQFFFEEPEHALFKKQAVKFGFDEEKYLKALEEVPIVSVEKVKAAMDFLLNMMQLITEMTFQKLEQIELNEAIHKSECVLRSNTIICDKNGTPETIISLAKDVTEQKRGDNQIKEQMEELRRWHEVTLNREGRILDLKQEVNELLKQLGKPVTYPSAEKS